MDTKLVEKLIDKTLGVVTLLFLIGLAMVLAVGVLATVLTIIKLFN